MPYSDYTFYKPINPWDKIKDPDCWQPIQFDSVKGDGSKVTPGFLTPHWYRVKPFALQRSDQWNVRTAREYLSFQTADPWADYWTCRQTLARARKALG